MNGWLMVTGAILTCSENLHGSVTTKSGWKLSLNAGTIVGIIFVAWGFVS